MSKGDQLKSIILPVYSILKPDLPNLWPGKSAKAGHATKVNKIAYLDGLRGMAAVVVYLTHHAMYAHENSALHRAFGWRGEYYLAAFPGIRLFFSGGALSVAIFFIISGYVCSLSALNSLHRGDLTKLANTLGTGLPRRFVRLYYPIFWITFLVGTAFHLFGITSSNRATPPPRPTYLLELQAWLSNFFRLTHLWGPGALGYDQYNPHLWNIPAQFRGMILVNASLGSMLVFHHWGPSARMWAMVALMVYFLVPVDGWYNAQYIMGMLICDIELLAEKDKLPGIFYKLKPLALGGWIWHIFFLISMWLAGVPRGVRDLDSISEHDPGWWFINLLTPMKTENHVWYWEFWAATFLLFAVPRISWLRSFFETSIPLYFGKLSFGLYLVHGPILWTVGDRVYAAVGRVNSVAAENIPSYWINAFPLPDWGPMGLEVNYIAAQMVLVPITLYLAGIAQKLLDEPSGQLANWLFDPKRFQATEPKKLAPTVVRGDNQV